MATLGMEALGIATLGMATLGMHPMPMREALQAPTRIVQTRPLKEAVS